MKTKNIVLGLLGLGLFFTNNAFATSNQIVTRNQYVAGHTDNGIPLSRNISPTQQLYLFRQGGGQALLGQTGKLDSSYVSSYRYVGSSCQEKRVEYGDWKITGEYAEIINKAPDFVPTDIVKTTDLNTIQPNCPLPYAKKVTFTREFFLGRDMNGECVKSNSKGSETTQVCLSTSLKNEKLKEFYVYYKDNYLDWFKTLQNNNR